MIMTQKTDLVKAWTDLKPDEIEEADKYLADDFENVDENGAVLMDKNGWIGMGQMLVNSFPDWEFVRTDLREEGDKVILTGHFQGTHQTDLDLSMMGLGVIPASGKKIVWPDESSRVTVSGGKIQRLEPYGEGGGMKAFLAGFGIN